EVEGKRAGSSGFLPMGSLGCDAYRQGGFKTITGLARSCTMRASPFKMVMFVPEDLRSRRACHFYMRGAQGGSFWGPAVASDSATDSPRTPTHATRQQTPCPRVRERAPNAARESQSSCHHRCGQFLRTDNSLRPRH